MAAAMPAQWVRFARVANAGHGAFRDDPVAFDLIRDFILAER
jgi:pimeloyl-ACP methyl ester carboxylesterase